MNVLVLAAHADDAEWYAGGTLAAWALAGHAVRMVIATDGRVGAFDTPPEALAALRAMEAERAASLIGAPPPILLGYRDFELDRLPAGHLRQQFVRLIRSHRPGIVVTFDLFCQEQHPDHRAVGLAAAEAATFAYLPALYPDAGSPFRLPERYYFGDSALPPNHVVDITATFETRLAMLAQHASQMTFLVADVLDQARLAGLADHPLFAAAQADPLAAVAMALRAQAQHVGATAGFELGEAFRVERFHPMVETLLRSASAEK
jgi:LmbE family N-acetylglucosaminyl deacetylase